MGHGADWIKNQYKKEMSPFGESVADLLDTLFAGIYHIAGPALKKVNWSHDDYVQMMLVDHASSSMSTFDFDRLTWLVLLSHDRCIRVSVDPGTFRQLKLLFHPRERHEQGMSFSKAMPTMEDHIAKLRSRVNAPS